MTDWREELIEKMALQISRAQFGDWVINPTEKTREQARAALAVAEPVIREQADNALREENARLREALEPFAPDSQWIDPAIPDGRPIDAMFLAGELRAARAAILGKVKPEAACPAPDEAL